MDPVLSTVCKEGFLKKVKPRLKNKYFVLHKDSLEQPARLEYYDSLKNWENKKKPKRILYLKICFSVNAYSNEKVTHGMALYTKDDSFQVSFENEEMRDSWLATIRALIHSHRDARPMFEHVWNVKIRERGLGRPYEGEYRLCLNDRTVMFVKKAAVDPEFTFPLEVVRRCGHSDNFFNLEVGRQACTGPGEFWMEVDDGLIAENVHHAIIAVMNKPKEDEDSFRPKSSSNSFNDKSTFGSRSGTMSSETGRGTRTRGSRIKSGPSFSSSNGAAARVRSDSIGSRSSTSTASTAVVGSASNLAVAALRSVDNFYSIDQTPPADGGPPSRPNSRSGTPVRSLTPDLRGSHTPRTSDAELVEANGVPYMAMDMSLSPFSSTHIKTQKSNSQSSINSWAGSRDQAPSLAVTQPPYADMTYSNVPSVARPRSTDIRAAAPPDDGSYAEMGPANQRSSQSVVSAPQPVDDSYLSMTPGSTAAPGPLSSSRKPENSQSYLSKYDDHSSAAYLEMAPTAAVAATNDSPYLDMAPAVAASLPPAADDSYFDMAPVTSNQRSQVTVMPANNDTPYLSMAPTNTTASEGAATNSPYLDMTPASAGNSGNDAAYLDMAPVNSGSSSHSLSSGLQSATAATASPYMDMQPSGSVENIVHARSNSLQLSIGALDDPKNPYLDMSGKDASVDGEQRRRLDSIRSYLSSTENVMTAEDLGFPTRHWSVGSRPAALQKPPNPDQYVEMCRSKDLNDFKSLSVPHLMPLSLASNPDLTHLQDEYASQHPTKPDTLMMLNFDRPRTSSESWKTRPRVATWSNNIRPRSSSHSQKQKASNRSNSSRESVQSAVSDYVDMQAGASSSSAAGESSYVEMTPSGREPQIRTSSAKHNRKNTHPVSGGARLLGKLSPPKAARSAIPGVATGKSHSYDTLSDRGTLNSSVDHNGYLPEDIFRNPHLGHIGRRMSQPHQAIDPFPELSASSEEEPEMRSGASSFSSTRSSSSSRSSLARVDNAPLKNSQTYGGGAGLDPESYVECQQVTMRAPGPNLHSHPASLTSQSSNKPIKPMRVASFISEELPTPTSTKPANPKADRKDKKSKNRNTDTYYELGSSAVAKKTDKRSSVKLPQAAASTPALPRPPDKQGQQVRQQSPQPAKQSSKHQPQSKTVPSPKTLQSNTTPASSTQSKAASSASAQKHRDLSARQNNTTLDSTNQKSHKPPPQSQTESRPTGANQAADPYMEMTPAAAPVSKSRPVPDDNYTTMSPLSKEEQCRELQAKNNVIFGLQAFKALPVIDRQQCVSDETSSESPSLASTETTQTTGTGSSGDSSHTLNDEQALSSDKTLPHHLTTLFSVSTRPMKTPKAVPCYIRQHSNDVNIYPSPAIPAACYIRSDSNMSQTSELGGAISSPTRRAVTHDDILSSLANAGLDNEDFYMNSPLPGAFGGLRRDQSDPISPIRLQSGDDLQSLPSVSLGYARSSSDSGSDTIPGSAAELQWQRTKQLEQVQEEERECKDMPTAGSAKDGGSGGSGKEGGPKTTVKSFIIDDTKPVAVRAPRTKPAGPPVPVRLVSVEEKSGSKLASAIDPLATTQPLNYVDIKHDDKASTSNPSTTTNNPSSSPKADGAATPQSLATNSHVNYTTIDHEKTQEFNKKGTGNITH